MTTATAAKGAIAISSGAAIIRAFLLLGRLGRGAASGDGSSGSRGTGTKAQTRRGGQRSQGGYDGAVETHWRRWQGQGRHQSSRSQMRGANQGGGHTLL